MPITSLVTAGVLLGATYFSSSIGLTTALSLGAAVVVALQVWRARRIWLVHLALLAAVPVMPLLHWASDLLIERSRTEQQQTVLGDLNALAGRLEQQLASNESHLNALALLVSQIDGFDQAQYRRWLDQLITDQPFSFLNVALSNDYILTHVYPETEANRAVLGVDLLTVSDQWQDVERVMATQEAVVTGPVTALQGDTALILRLPVPNRPQMTVTGVLSLDTILSTARQAGTEPWLLGLRLERDGVRTDLVTSDFASGADPVYFGFSYRGYVWQLRAMPEQGWSIPSESLWLLRLAASLVWLFVFIILGWQYRVMRQRDAERLQLRVQEHELLEAQRLGKMGSWTSADQTTFELSRPLSEMMGTARDELSLTEIQHHIYEPDREYFNSHAEQVIKHQQAFTRFEHRLITPEQLLWVEHSIALDARGNLSGILRDITELKSTEAELQKLAYYDSLTGASNRNFFGKQVQQGIALAKRNNHHLALVLFDLNNFKAINAQYGHTLGDEILKLMTERIKSCIRRSDTIARLSGDTFAVCLQNLQDPSHSIFVADNILNRIAENIEIDDMKVSLTGTIGIATCPEDDSRYEGLVKKAEMALQKAKEVDRGYYRFYSEQLNRENDRRQDILQLLPIALNNEEFHLALQPRISAEQHQWSSLEVLLRWHNSVLGPVSPAEFIPIAEGNHLIVDIGYWVIRESLAAFAQNLHHLPDDLVLSINLSPRQLEHRDLCRFVASELHISGVPAHRLEFEITEHSVTEESDQTLSTLAELSAMGIRFAMDDFGTGYSNLGMLQALPLQVLKIDKRFVQEIHQGGKHLALIQAIINLGHTLGLMVVAEGVETEEQAATLTQLGCDELQGFFFFKPEPFETLLERAPRTRNA
ncbi:MAG: bifunctional diguanylate cyclase/phosphodiesterase [Saccharospirillum sp.]